MTSRSAGQTNRRFEGAPAPRLEVLDGKMIPQQLQTMRPLTPESARLLSRC